MKLRIAVVGCGYWGKNLIRSFAKLGALACVVDANSVLSDKFSKEHQVASCSLEEMLIDPTITAVVIAVPAELHFDIAKKALVADKHVFVEKPLALSITEGEELIRLAKNKNKTLMVGHLLRYHPAFLELQKIIKKGTLGKIRYLYSNRLNLGKFRTEENILWSFAPHDISMILALTENFPEKVQASGAHYLNPMIADVTTTCLSFKNGISAHIFVSWLHPYKEQKLVVIGEEGMVVFDDGLAWENKLMLYPHKVEWINQNPVPNKGEGIAIQLVANEPLLVECKHFLESITQKQTPFTDGEEGLNVLKVLDAAERSMKSHQPVYFSSSKEPAFFKHETAIIESSAVIGEGTKIWHFSHIMKETNIGEHVTIGQNVLVAPKVVIGDNCKIQNNVSLYTGVILEQGVFCGPSCVFTNVHNPRAEIERKNEFLNTLVERGVTIGANATIICGIKLGAYSFIGAGAVVTKDVPMHALVVGNPARQVGWVSHAGERLGEDLVCPREGRQYHIDNGQLRELTIQLSTSLIEA